MVMEMVNLDALVAREFDLKFWTFFYKDYV